MISEASSWTEYNSETTLTESEVDLDIDDVIAVRKVTKVTRTVEVSDDGGEKTVSKVTELTTEVTEDGDTKVTHEILEEKVEIVCFPSNYLSYAFSEIMC